MKTLHDIRLRFVAMVAGFLLTGNCLAGESGTEVLPAVASDVIQHQTTAYTAKLKIVSVQEAESKTLYSGKRIAGYPLASDLKKLNINSSRKLSVLVLDTKNHIYVRQRCKNSSMRGVRFLKADKVVEVVIGAPCNQMIVAYKNNGENGRWGVVLAGDIAKEITALLDK